MFKKNIQVIGFPEKITNYLVKEASQLGISVSHNSIFEAVVCLDPPVTVDWIEKCIAVIAEPKIVSPQIYQPSVLSRFRAVVTVSEVRAEKISADYWIEMPMIPIPVNTWPKVRKNRTCCVFGNKFSASKLSNYGLRRSVLKLDQQLESRLDLYGVDWLDPLWLQLQRRLYAMRIQFRDLNEFSIREVLGDLNYIPKNYRGVMSSEMSELFHYETSLIIENQSDYVSEKLWNSLIAGTVPFYVGPRISNQRLSQCLIYAGDTPSEIVSVIYRTTIEEIYEKRRFIYKFLQDYDFENAMKKYAKNLMQIVRNVLVSC